MKLKLITLAIGGALLGTAACSLDVPDLNNPGLDTLEDTPTAVSVGAACTGLLIGNRGVYGTGNGYVMQLGILGREAYNFTSSDPRYIGEMLEGSLQAGSPFGGAFWGAPYNNIRLANVTLKSIDKLNDTEMPPADKHAARGFVNTIYALDLLMIINTHDTNGAVIDTDKQIVLPPAVQPLGAIVGKPEVFAEIAKRLDNAASELAMAGDSFPFLLSSGYAGFDTPETFLTFNRAVRARVAAYTKDYAGTLTALGASFLDDDTVTAGHVIDMQLGVYHSYSTKTGDATNALAAPLSRDSDVWAHPSLETDVQKNGAANDARYTAKVRPSMSPGSVTGKPLMSMLQFKIYPSPDSPIPVIRNEELILLKAEALWFTGNKAGAMTELNIVRVQSGKLAAIATTPPSDTAFLDALLYERRYSLLFEGGHRWIDVRRFDRVMDLPLDDPGHVRNIRYPFPTAECNARPNDAACAASKVTT
jgi:hypothetical protein